MKYYQFVAVSLWAFVVFSQQCYAFVTTKIPHRFSRHFLSDDIDPNFEAHLPTLLKAGSNERPSPNLARNLRKRFKDIEVVKREAANELKLINAELAAELEEIADELNDTHEMFVQAALVWNAWDRPSPDLGSELRAQADLRNVRSQEDPNFASHLPGFLAAGAADDRPDPELPSALRLMKFKNNAGTKRLAAQEIRSSNPKLAQTLEEIASEMEESHERFVQLAASQAAARQRDDLRPAL